MKKPDHKYIYHAKIDRIIDGDTIVVFLDLGLDLTSKQVLRLNRINAPEKRGIEKPYGLQSEKALDEWKAILDCTDSSVEIETTKKGKYGRYIAEVWFRFKPENEMQNLSDYMVEAGFAEYKDY